LIVMQKGSSPTKKSIGTIAASFLLVVGILAVYGGHPASAVMPTVNLGTAAPFAVLAYSGITNTGTTTITGDVGSYPTATETGFGSVTITGTNYPSGAPSSTQTDLAGAITQAMSYAPSSIPSALDGQTLVAGVYSSPSTQFTLSGGILTLNGQGDPSSVWIFQAGDAIAGALTTTGSSVVLENGADSCNVFWVASAGGVTIGTNNAFVGTIMAYSSVTLATGTSLQGAALANTGDVTLQSNTISTACVTATISSSSSTTSSSSSSSSSTTSSSSSTSTTTTTTTTTSPVPQFPFGIAILMVLAIPLLLLMRGKTLSKTPG